MTRKVKYNSTFVELADFERRFRNTIDHALEGMIWISTSGQILFANPTAVRLLGYANAAELMAAGSSLQKNLFADPDDRQIFLEHCAREESITLECELNRKGGGTLPVCLHATGVRDEFGRLQYYEEFFVDITSQKTVEKAIRLAEERYRLLIENAVCAIYRSTVEGRFLEVNHALVAMLGYGSREELLNVSLEDGVYAEPGGRRRLIEEFENIERIGGVRVQWKKKDGSRFWVRLSGRKTRNAFGILDGFEVIAEAT